MTTTTGKATLTRVEGPWWAAATAVLGTNPSVTTINDEHYRFKDGSVRQLENHGAVAHVEGAFLVQLAAKLGGPVLEIGSDLGISTRYICWGLQCNGKPGKCYAVDNHHKWQDDDVLEYPQRVQVDSDSRFYRCPEVPTFAFLDGDHRFKGVLQDIEAATASGARLLVFHDTRPGQPKPTNTSNGSEAREAVLEVFGDIEGVTIYDWASPCGMMIVKLPGSEK